MEIKSKYKFTRMGEFMYRVCARWTKFILKHRWLYYVLMFTWALPVTLMGLIGALVLMVAGKKPHKFYWVFYQEVGEWWGGLEMGVNFFRDKKSGYHYINNHEQGHSIAQISWMGVFAIFVVMIPSAIRYWYQEFRSRKGKPNKDYDAIWFESAATDCGDYAVWYLDKVKEAKIKSEVKEDDHE